MQFVLRLLPAQIIAQRQKPWIPRAAGIVRQAFVRFFVAALVVQDFCFKQTQPQTHGRLPAVHLQIRPQRVQGFRKGIRRRAGIRQGAHGNTVLRVPLEDFLEGLDLIFDRDVSLGQLGHQRGQLFLTLLLGFPGILQPVIELLQADAVGAPLIMGFEFGAALLVNLVQFGPRQQKLPCLGVGGKNGLFDHGFRFFKPAFAQPQQAAGVVQPAFFGGIGPGVQGRCGLHLALQHLQQIPLELGRAAPVGFRQNLTMARFGSAVRQPVNQS